MANDATGISRKRDVFQLDDNGAPDADTSDAVGWSREDGLGYRMLGRQNVVLAVLSILYPRLGSVGKSLTLATRFSWNVWAGPFSATET